MAEQQRKIVFFVGAGASVGAGACARVQHGKRISIPTQKDFWNIFLRFCKSDDNRIAIESFLFRYFLGYARVPGKLDPGERRTKFKDIDVEEVFTFLSERSRAPSTTAAMKGYTTKIWKALVDELPNVFSHFEVNSRTRFIYRQFADNFVLSRDTLVSFNFDTIMEHSFPKRFKWHYEVLESVGSSVGVLKPHGSVNWENIEPIQVKDDPNSALIVAPTHLKFVKIDSNSDNSVNGYLDNSKSIKKIWQRMEHEMSEAKALVFIGYSFPVADLYFSSVLRSVLADRDGAPGIAIVNPDAVAIGNRLRNRFHLENIALYFDLQNFVRGSRHEVLTSLGKA